MRDKPPFCWCHDDEIPDEIFEANDGIMEYPDDAAAFRRQQPDAAPQEPQEGEETFTTSWDELLYMMTNGEMGVQPPETPQRYQPQQQKHPQR